MSTAMAAQQQQQMRGMNRYAQWKNQHVASMGNAYLLQQRKTSIAYFFLMLL